MHCPACNTENAPDSRFCGGCGRKLAIARPRVAPTAKIPDDAGLPTVAPSLVYAPNPISHSSLPAPAHRVEPASGPMLRVPSASLSLATPRPRTGVIAAVLVLDLALVGAGAVLFVKGLAVPPATPKEPPTGPPALTVSPISRQAPHEAIGSAAQTAGEPPGSAGSAAPVPALVTTGSAGSATTAAAPVATGSAAPRPKRVALESYEAARALANEVELATARTAHEFDHCSRTATASDARGVVQIGFVVAVTGRVERVQATQNTTGIAELGRCLAQAIASWSFAAHPLHPTWFTRRFLYPRPNRDDDQTRPL